MVFRGQEPPVQPLAEVTIEFAQGLIHFIPIVGHACCSTLLTVVGSRHVQNLSHLLGAPRRRIPAVLDTTTCRDCDERRAKVRPIPPGAATQGGEPPPPLA